jgi:lysophospholipase L1-like esterase
MTPNRFVKIFLAATLRPLVLVPPAGLLFLVLLTVLLVPAGTTWAERLVFLGDSLTSGGPWAGYFPGHQVVNAGRPGDTVDGMIERLEPALSPRPDLLFLMGGINDLGQGTPIAVVFSRYADLVRRAGKMAPGTRVVIQSTLPVNHDEYGVRIDNRPVLGLNRRLARLAIRYQAQYVDLWPALTTADDQLAAQLTHDGIHLNLEGYGRWRERIQPLIPPPGEGIPMEDRGP